MDLGLFLDVDGVLTDKAVNLQYAQLLGVQEKLVGLERRYANRRINNDQFNAEFIPLFREAGFNLSFALDNFDKVQMRANFGELLNISANAFLVTSGPSYFIQELMRRQNMRPENVVCSEYEFDADGLICRCVKPVTSAVKGHFVKERAKRFDMSLGVGDTDQDIEFLSHCNIKFLMESNRLEYFSARELQPIIDLVRSITAATQGRDQRLDKGLAKLYARKSYDKNIFIMTPFHEDARFRLTIKVIKETLAESGLTGWLASDLDLSRQLWSNVETFLNGCKGAVAVFTRDLRRPMESGDVFNPNVSIEVGYAMAQQKPVLLLKDKQLKALPTDMMGFLYADFDIERAEITVREVVRRWVAQHF